MCIEILRFLFFSVLRNEGDKVTVSPVGKLLLFDIVSNSLISSDGQFSTFQLKIPVKEANGMTCTVISGKPAPSDRTKFFQLEQSTLNSEVKCDVGFASETILNLFPFTIDGYRQFVFKTGVCANANAMICSDTESCFRRCADIRQWSADCGRDSTSSCK